MTVHRSVMIALLLLAASGIVRGAGYWVYSYQGVDVMAAGDAALARTLAHNVHRVDRIARTLIDWDTAARLPPTHIYLLHHPTFVQVMQPPKFSDRYQMWAVPRNGFVLQQGENYIAMDALDGTTNRYYGAYFGLGGSIVAGEGMHYPGWFTTGFAELLASTRISGNKVTVGPVDPWVGKIVLTRALKFIPTQTLLRLKSDDPLLQQDFMGERYAAQCWLLVHLMMIEGLHKAEFVHYLTSLSGGMDEADAFAASFKLSYEDLDKMLKQTIEDGSVATRSFDLPDEPDTDAPRLLTPADADARTSRLTEVMHRRFAQ